MPLLAFVPGAAGEFTVMPGHSPVLSTLRPGVMEVTMDGAKTRLYVKSGVIDVGPESVTVLAQAAFDFAEADAARLQEELKAAQAEREAADDSDDELIEMAEHAIDTLTRVSGGMDR